MVTGTTGKGATMTDRRAYATAFVLAPVTAGVLSVSAGWALGHDPRGAGAPAVPAAASSTAPVPASLAELQAHLLAVTRRYETARVRLLDAERRIQANMRQLEGIKKADTRSFGAASGDLAPAPSVPAPAAPPVSTTTGAS